MLIYFAVMTLNSGGAIPEAAPQVASYSSLSLYTLRERCKNTFANAEYRMRPGIAK